MKKVLLFTLLLAPILASAAQAPDAGLREAEWQSHKLPSSEFVRYSDPDKGLVLWVPTTWERQPDGLKFTSSDGAELHIAVENIPDGVPLKSFLMAVMKNFGDLLGSTESLLVRRTRIGGVDARELLFELVNERGVLTRRSLWLAVEGPRAYTVVMIAPLARAQQIDPYFKAVIESMIIWNDTSRAGAFETERGRVFKTRPARIDGVLSLVPVLDGLDGNARSGALSKLVSAFTDSPDVALDLLIDRRPMVRAAAAQAIGLSNNKALGWFVAAALRDRDSFVAGRAAEALAKHPNAADLLREQTLNWFEGEPLLRAWSFLAEETRARLMSEIFEPPKATRAPLVLKRRSAAPKKGELKGIVVSTPDPNKHFVTLNLLREVSAADFKMPFGTIAELNNDTLTVTALEIALERREKLPIGLLFKLLSSSTQDVRLLAARNLAQSAESRDVSKIKELSAKLLDSREPGKNEEPTGGSTKAFKDELELSVKKIEFREEIQSANPDVRDVRLKAALDDKSLAEWVWTEYLHDRREGPKEKMTGPTSVLPAVSPLGENLFPENVVLYTALPRPSVMLARFFGSLSGIQMNSARDQANLVLFLNTFRERLAGSLGAAPDRSFLDYLGINFNAPLALASWTAKGGSRNAVSADRRALVVRVSDRERFERTLSLFQKHLGGFKRLFGYIPVGARFLELAPAILPASAAMVASTGLPERKRPKLFTYNLVRREECLGYHVTVLERHEGDEKGHASRDSIYVVYVADAAILAPDWYSLRDALTRLAGNRPGVVSNPEFKRAVATGGDIVYFSDLSAIDWVPTAKSKAPDTGVTESGAFKVSGSVWESSFNLSFKNRDWIEPLIPFSPADVSAPRDLLPASTIGYVLMNLNAASAIQRWKGSLFDAGFVKSLGEIWMLDFERDVVTQLGPECGAALLGMPKFDSEFSGLPWVIFFKLKSDLLGAAFRAGRLLKGVESGGKPARVKIGATEVVILVKDGFLVVSGNEATMGRLDQKEKLAAEREFAGTIASAPKDIVMFGGFNLEAAVATIKAPAHDPVAEHVITSLTSLVRAFHSQNLYARVTSDGIEARLSVSLDRGGRYSVAELSSLSKDFQLAYAVVQARGLQIREQDKVESLKLRIRARGSGAIDRIQQDIASKDQVVEKQSDGELVVTVRPRRAASGKSITLPVADPELAPFLRPTRDIRSDDKTVIEKAREIAGDDRDAWSVARKLADWTYKNLTWKRVDDATAVETLATREADCLEFSQLFVAMARALGLPARLVMGLAFTEGSFGAHAWVEVYAGEWVEMDPTWGRDFADATHLRESSGGLLSYAALNLIDIEILEAPRAVPEYQRSARSLVDALCREIFTGRKSILSDALDVAFLADQHMGPGTWSSLSQREREQMSAAYHRVIGALSAGSDIAGDDERRSRILRLSETSSEAEAVIMAPYLFYEALLRLRLTKSQGAWTISEVTYADSGYRVIEETIRPIYAIIQARRIGKQGPLSYLSPTTRALLIIGDLPAALETVEQALKDDPSNRTLRNLKAQCLYGLKRTDDAVKLYAELCEENPPFAPAMRDLATHYEADEPSRDKAIKLFERYAELAPEDPRPHGSLAALYEKAGDLARAETAYRAQVERDASGDYVYLDLAEFLTQRARHDEALAVIDDGAKRVKSGTNLYADLISRFYGDEAPLAEKLVAARPERLEKNAEAGLHLAWIRIYSGRAGDALLLLRSVIALDPKSVDAQNAMAEAHRALRQWKEALASANAAVQLDGDDAQAHYNRACALAQLGRRDGALLALHRAIELDEELAYEIGEEEDLKPLSRLPGFKKLLPRDEKNDK